MVPTTVDCYRWN